MDEADEFQSISFQLPKYQIDTLVKSQSASTVVPKCQIGTLEMCLYQTLGEYDITADELLSGAGGTTATKTEQAERLILDLLADGKELASEDIEKAATEAGISARTVRAAKRNLDGRITSKRIGAAWYHALKK